MDLIFTYILAKLIEELRVRTEKIFRKAGFRLDKIWKYKVKINENIIIEKKYSLPCSQKFWFWIKIDKKKIIIIYAYKNHFQ